MFMCKTSMRALSVAIAVSAVLATGCDETDVSDPESADELVDLLVQGDTARRVEVVRLEEAVDPSVDTLKAPGHETRNDTASGMVPKGQWHYYKFTKYEGTSYYICVDPQGGNPDLYGDYKTFPTLDNDPQFKRTNTGLADDCFAFTAKSTGPYYLGVYGKGTSNSYILWLITTWP